MNNMEFDTLTVKDMTELQKAAVYEIALGESDVKYIAQAILETALDTVFVRPMEFPDTTSAFAMLPSPGSEEFITKGTVKSPYLNIFPNPAGEVIGIDYALSDPSPANLTIIDFNGRVAYQLELTAENANYQVDVSHLPTGLYLMRLDQQGNALLTKKWAIIR